MNCPQCSNEMIKAKATDFGKEYFYCRTCKKELAEMSPKMEKVKPVTKCAHDFYSDTLLCRKCGDSAWDQMALTPTGTTVASAIVPCPHLYWIMQADGTKHCIDCGGAVQ